MSMTQSILITPGADAGIFTGGGGATNEGSTRLTFLGRKIKMKLQCAKKERNTGKPIQPGKLPKTRITPENSNGQIKQTQKTPVGIAPSASPRLFSANPVKLT